MLVIGGSDGCSDLDTTELLDLSLGATREEHGECAGEILREFGIYRWKFVEFKRILI
jgi:hypothetical protein